MSNIDAAIDIVNRFADAEAGAPCARRQDSQTATTEARR